MNDVIINWFMAEDAEMMHKLAKQQWDIAHYFSGSKKDMVAAKEIANRCNDIGFMIENIIGDD